MQSNRETVGKLILTAVLLAIVAAAFLVVQRYGVTPAPIAAAHPKPAPTTRPVTAPRAFKVLHIMSYHTPWEWTENQFSGFKDALHGLNVEYKVYEMDAKRQSSKEHLQQASDEARQLIEEWKPDLVYTSDDAAQQYVAIHYKNSSIPFVFSAVNASPEDYGYVGTKNMTGVLEREHIVQTIRLLRQLVPNVRRIAIISDPAPMWRPVAQRINQRIKEGEELADISVVADDVVETFEDWQRTIMSYQDKADAIAILGAFNIRGPDGKNLTYEELGRWTAENSNVPEFSFWADRVSKGGGLCAVAVSGFAQGQEAGKIARAILVNGKSPSSIPMTATLKGEPVISLPRAQRLGLSPSSDVLLSAKVFAKYGWEE
ncbi:MAG: hypothetical protein MUP47_05870 [Phycisphaerae bacterium]|nr:hypothetical protein [Phycisphaerae bacterium]